MHERAAPAAGFDLVQQPPRVIGFCRALQAVEHDHDRASAADPIDIEKVTVGKLDALSTGFQPNARAAENGPDRLEVAIRKPPRGAKAVVGFPIAHAFIQPESKQPERSFEDRFHSDVPGHCPKQPECGSSTPFCCSRLKRRE